MARPKTISSEQILKAARELFLDHGHSCSTAHIARAAGVSEGTIFKRFGTKEKLFHCAMGLPKCAAFEQLGERIGQGDLRENLITLSFEIVAFFREMMPRMRTLMSHPGYDPIKFLKGNPKAPPLEAVKALTSYFDGEVRAGRIRHCDPEVLARMMLGSLHNFVFLEEIGVHERMPMAAQSYVRAFVDLLWTGLDPSSPSGDPSAAE